MRKIILSAALIGSLGALSLVAAAPAVAATPAPSAAGGTAPACIARYTGTYSGNTWYAIVDNHCGKTMRVQVLGSLSWQKSACHTLAPGASFRHTDKFGKYRKTVVC